VKLGELGRAVEGSVVSKRNPVDSSYERLEGGRYVYSINTYRVTLLRPDGVKGGSRLGVKLVKLHEDGLSFTVMGPGEGIEDGVVYAIIPSGERVMRDCSGCFTRQCVAHGQALLLSVPLTAV
jgi:hypothetical protein